MNSIIPTDVISDAKNVAKIEANFVSSFIKKLEVDINSINVSKNDPSLRYRPFYDVPMDIKEMSKYTPQIGELCKFNSKIVRAKILEILNRNLGMNLKGRIVDNKYAITCIVDYIVKRCHNLEIQELDYILRSGVMGLYGNIYNDISIDTICGSEGWIEIYYQKERGLRPEPNFIEKDSYANKISELVPTGELDKFERKVYDRQWKEIENPNPMTLEEFLDKNPDYRNKLGMSEIYIKAKNRTSTIEDAKKFYTLKGFNLDDFKDDMEYHSKNYYKLHQKLDILIYELNEIYFLIELCENKNTDDFNQLVVNLKDKEIVMMELKQIIKDGESTYINKMLRRFILDNIYNQKR